MRYRTELTLEDLLAEPIVVTLMRRDGVSPEEVRHLREKVGRGRRGRKGKAKAMLLPGGFGLRVNSSQLCNEVPY
jgi:hypothetical protein